MQQRITANLLELKKSKDNATRQTGKKQKQTKKRNKAQNGE